LTRPTLTTDQQGIIVKLDQHLFTYNASCNHRQLCTVLGVAPLWCRQARPR